MLSKTAYAPIRLVKEESREWLDIGCLDFSEAMVRANVLELQGKMPQWDKANSVQRIVRVSITELEN